jgi:HK97 gp10 family phage protein
MVGTVTTAMRGLREAEAALKELGPRLASQAGDGALRAMAKPIVADVRMLAPKRTGKYAKAIRFVLRRKNVARDQRAGRIGVRAPFNRIAHLLEFGHRARDGSHVAAHPHFRPALDARAQDAIKAGGEAIAKQIARVAEKLANKNPVTRGRR